MADKPLTWEEKLAKGLPLSELEQVKADATRLTLRRIRDNQADQEYKAEKAEAPKAAPVLVEAPAESVAQEPQDSKQKKGN